MPRSLVAFFGLSFLLAWMWWIAVAAVTAPSLSPAIRGLLFLPGTFAPGIVAIWLTMRADGAAGTRTLVSRLRETNVRVRWYVFAVGYMAAVKLAAAVAHRTITGVWPLFGQQSWYLLLAAVAFSTPFQAGEEIGWRGYALPRLASRIGLALGSVVLGVIWAFWHLPLFFIPWTDNARESFPLYVLSVTALSVAMAWLYGHTRGSLLLAMIMHAAINNTTGIVPSIAPDATNPLSGGPSMMAWLTSTVLWAGAAYFLARMSRQTGEPLPLTNTFENTRR